MLQNTQNYLICWENELNMQQQTHYIHLPYLYNMGIS